MLVESVFTSCSEERSNYVARDIGTMADSDRSSSHLNDHRLKYFDSVLLLSGPLLIKWLVQRQVILSSSQTAKMAK